MPHKRAKRSARDADKLSKGQNNPPPKPSADAHFHSLPKGAMRILNAAKIQSDYNARKKARLDLENGILPPGQEIGEMSKTNSRGKGKQKEKERKVQEAKDELKIKPGEKVGDFNRRIDRIMAPGINAAMRTEAKSTEKAKRKKRKLGQEDGEGSETEDTSESLRKERADTAASHKASEASSSDLRKAREGLQNQVLKDGSLAGEDRDWVQATQRRRINDVAMEPPTFTKAPRGHGKISLVRKARLKAALSGEDMDEAEKKEGDRKVARLPDPIRKEKKEGKVETSMARQNILLEEREKAIKAYRARKEEGIREKEEIRKNKK